MIDPLHYFFIFFKASLFSTGGLSNLPSLRQDLLAEGWAEDSEFGRSVVIGQLSPGPNGLWVISLGYLTYGFAGAMIALIAIILPAFLVLFVAAGYGRISQARWVGGAMRGVAIAVVGISLSVVWTIMHQPGVDRWGLAIAAVAFGLVATKRIRLPFILALAAGAGLLLYR